MPLALRVVITLLIVWHFTGVFLAALSQPFTSRLVLDISQDPPMQWYLDALYMNQAHSFFAPEVGPGHLIRYELFDQGGRLLEQGELPDRKEHWPRLRYHRHFMLADQAGFPSDNKEVYDYWMRKYLDSYARHLLRTHDDAESVRVLRVLHYPTPRGLVLEGRKLTDPASYETEFQITLHRSALGPPAEDQSRNGHQQHQPQFQQQYRQPQQPTSTAQRWIGVPR